MSNENKIEFLWNCAKALNSEKQTHKLLKSYYINTCRKLAKSNLQIPKEKFALSQMCSFCGSFWSESEFSLKLIPKQLNLSSREKKLIEDFEKKDGSGKVLSKKQKNRAKWLIKKRSKRVAIKCEQCKHRSFVNMKYNRSKSLTHPPKNEKSEEKTIAPNKYNKYLPDTFKKKDDMLSSLTQASKTKRVVEKQITSNCKNKTNQTLSNKVISKTQKNNSLLQLAALLKKQTTVDAKSVTQQKLQTLFK